MAKMQIVMFCVFVYSGIILYGINITEIPYSYEDSACEANVCCWTLSVLAGISKGMSLTTGVGVASKMSAGVCSVANETGGTRSDGASDEGSGMPGMLGRVAERTEGMGRGEIPGKFSGGRGGMPAERESSI
ncbi:hypothetical protein DNTS_015381 [Danionella cerebrum]|uniref:Uncharacterized protein n=1 Tax=Danionella cerebrum TaxID=2873325 RepID=A0A553N4H9_9TELE|nr:hypothetical protein DNTS_015381 [Danionella translucida]